MTAPFNFEHAFLKLFTDEDPGKCSELGMHNIGGHYQAGTAVRCITHFRQMYEAKRFQYYDHGDRLINQEVYGQDSPPEIDLQTF